MRTTTTLALLPLLAMLALGCQPKRIPGISIALKDTPDHRAIVDLVEQYRRAVESKDIDALLALADERFYEDSGTPETEDDYNYQGLREHFEQHFEHLGEVQLNIILKDVEVSGDQADVDYRYVARYRMDLPSGEKWRVIDEVNRLELVRQGEGPDWKVKSGF